MGELGPPEQHPGGELGWLTDLRRLQPDFRGNWEHLVEFARLATSRTKSPNDERGRALSAWDSYFMAPPSSLATVQKRNPKLPGKSQRKLVTAKKWASIPRPRPIDLSEINLDRALLGRVNLTGAMLTDASLRGASLKRATLYNAHLAGAQMTGAILTKADLEEAKLYGACLDEAVLEGARLVGAKFDADSKLRNANLQGVDLTGAVLRGTDLSGADLRRAVLVGADLRGANLSGCKVYGVSAWDVKLDDNAARQSNLIVSPDGDPTQVVDRLDVAQFYYLLLHNPNIRHVINTVGRKGVLILGRFGEGRLAVLEKIRDTLREAGYLPFLFNFLKPDDRTYRETVVTLAGLSRFVIADLTKPKSAPFELGTTFPVFAIPYAPIIARGEKRFSMFKDMTAMDPERVLPELAYGSAEELAKVLKPAIIDPAEEIASRLTVRRNSKLPTRDARDYLPEKRRSGRSNA